MFINYRSKATEKTLCTQPFTFKMSTQAHSKPRKLKIIHVGAGASGLLTAYKAERMLQNYELVCYDK